jgi:MFS transporter, DHA1 family, multidrug resistance protein
VQSFPRARTPGWLWLVAAMTAVGPISIDMYLPGFPDIEREFGVDGVENTMGAYLLGVAFGQLVYGPLSDRFGRKPPLYVAFVLYALGALACALASSLDMLTIARVVQALGGCAGMVIGRAIVRDRSDVSESARAFSTLAMIVSVGPVIAPAAGGVVVAAFGWRATFVFQAAVGVGLLLAMHALLREVRSPEAAQGRPTSALRVYGALLRDRVLVGHALIAGFGMGAMFGYVSGAPTVLIERYGMSAHAFGSLIALNGGAFFVASRLNIRALTTSTPERVLKGYVWAPLVLSVALLLVSLATRAPLWAFVPLQLAFFVSVGCINPNAFALALARHGAQAGAASALMGALQSVIAMTAGFAVAYFNDGEPATLAALMTVGAALVVVSYLWVAPRNEALAR